MSDNDLQRLHELLDRATAPADGELGSSDIEAASLRSGWVGLCRLIEEEERAGQVVQRGEIEPSRRPVRHSLSHSPVPPAAWTVWLTAAVAASILVAVSMTTVVKHFRGQQIAEIARPADEVSRPSQHPNTASIDQPSAASDRLQWGDSVDDEITAVSRGTLLAQDDWYVQSSRFGAVQSGIFELENEIEQGKP
jgi:hypothetical protein